MLKKNLKNDLIIMPTFRIKGKKFKELKSQTFKTELELQTMVDNNLKEIWGLEFIRREFGGQGLFIDTITYDPQTKGPVLIEYKKSENNSVIAQGMAYLRWLLDHKGDYQVELEEKVGKRDIDWSQARVLFVAANFHTHQVHALGFKGLPLELWKYELCGDTFIIQQVETPKSDVSFSSVLKGKTAKMISEQVKVYTVDDHLRKGSSKTKDLFQKIREEIFRIDERVREKPVTSYIGFKINWYNFVTIHIFRQRLKIEVRKNKFEKDKEKRFKRYPASYGYGKTPLWKAYISKEDDIDYIMPIIKESYKAAPDK